MRFQKDGPKRRRHTRRELPYGQVRRWGSTVGNFKREREARRAGLTGGAQRITITTPTYAPERDPATVRGVRESGLGELQRGDDDRTTT